MKKDIGRLMIAVGMIVLVCGPVTAFPGFMLVGGLLLVYKGTGFAYPAGYAVKGR